VLGTKINGEKITSEEARFRGYAFRSGEIEILLECLYGAVIEGPELRAMGPKQFPVGTSIVNDDHGLIWTAGSGIWIAIDAIATITEVSDAAGYRNRLAIHRENP
jgi:hypothetical protein